MPEAPAPILPHEALPPPTIDPGFPSTNPTSSFWHNPPHEFLNNHRTTTKLPEHVNTVIIGSGLAGTMLYHNLRTLSLAPPNSTLMLEARSTCFGATGRNGGHCKPMLYQAGFFEEFAQTFGLAATVKRVKFEMINLSLVRELVEAEAVDCEWIDCPSADVYYNEPLLDIAKSNIRALEKAAPELARLVRIVDGATEEGRRELREDLRTPTAAGAVVFKAAKLWPYKLITHILAKAVREQGLNLQTNTPAKEIRKGADGLWEVETPRGTVRAERVVVAANAYTAHLLPQFRGYIYPVRAQMAALRPPRSLKERPLTHTYVLVREDRKKADYLIQRPFGKDGSGGELMLGGGRHMEVNHGIGLGDDGINEEVGKYLREAISGYFAEEKGYGEEEAVGRSFIADFRRLRLSGRKGRDVWDAAEGLGMGESETDDEFDALKRERRREEEVKVKACEAVKEWSGTMGFSRDECPFVGRVPPVLKEDAEERDIPVMEDTKGLWMLAGFEGHGMAFTTGSAKALSLMIYAEEHDMDVEDEVRLYDWFPRTFETSSRRVGLREGPEREDEWVLVEQQ